MIHQSELQLAAVDFSITSTVHTPIPSELIVRNVSVIHLNVNNTSMIQYVDEKSSRLTESQFQHDRYSIVYRLEKSSAKKSRLVPNRYAWVTRDSRPIYSKLFNYFLQNHHSGVSFFIHLFFSSMYLEIHFQASFYRIIMGKRNLMWWITQFNFVSGIIQRINRIVLEQETDSRLISLLDKCRSLEKSLKCEIYSVLFLRC